MHFAALSSLVSVVAAAAAADDATPRDKFVHLPMNRLEVEPDAVPLRRRASNFDLPVHYNETRNGFYAVDIKLGTPPQPVTLLLDTMFSDTVVLDEIVCHQQIDCDRRAMFVPDKSSTYESNGTKLSEDVTGSPVTGSDVVIGEWAQDLLQLGGHNITHFNFGLANQSSTIQSHAGLAPAAGEYVYQAGILSTPYANLPQQLKQQGAVDLAAFSLWLNPNGTGSAVFGGIDTAKYTTDLYRLPLLRTLDNTTVTQFAVQLTGLSVYDGDGNEQPFTTCDYPVVLDSSYPFSRLPLDLVKPIYEALGVMEYDSGIYVVPCDMLDSLDGGIGIQLGSGLDVTVSFSDLFVYLRTPGSGGVRYCVPGFLHTEDWPAQLGENVLQSLYVVYDLENLEVGIAPAQTGSAASSSSIQALSTGIPGPLITNALYSAPDEVFDYATTPVTLITPTFTRPAMVSNAPGIDSWTAALSTWGYTHGSWTAPASVTQRVVIGAKSGALATKGASIITSDTSAKQSSTARTSSRDAAATAAGTSSASSQGQTGADRQPSGSSITSPSARASSKASSSAQTSTGGARATQASSLLAALAGVVLTFL